MLILNNLHAFSVVFAATSPKSVSFSSATFRAISGMYELSFLFPRNGIGVSYGESVSSRIFSSGIFFTLSATPAFLKVTTPPIPTDQSPYFCNLMKVS